MTPIEAADAAIAVSEVREDPESDELLAARRDAASFSRLYRRHVQNVYRFPATRVGTRQEAEDVTSEAFQRAWSSRGRYQSNRPFRAWLFGIVRHTLADHHRHRAAPTIVDLEAARSVTDDAQSLDRGYDQIELRERCAAVLAQLNCQQQEVICLRFIADLSYSEIALVVGKREDAVKKIVYRARDDIRRRLKVDE